MNFFLHHHGNIISKLESPQTTSWFLKFLKSVFIYAIPNC